MTSYARRLDPATSHAAARRAEQSGLVETDAALFARLVRERPGITLREMGEAVAGEDPHLAAYWQVRLNRRSGDVREKKLAHTTGIERDGAQCWFPGPEPEAGKQGALFETPERRVWD